MWKKHIEQEKICEVIKWSRIDAKLDQMDLKVFGGM